MWVSRIPFNDNSRSIMKKLIFVPVCVLSMLVTPLLAQAQTFIPINVGLLLSLGAVRCDLHSRRIRTLRNV
ncbi:hypothetical protein ES703_99878 [subsurface metagenome]